MVAVLSGIAAVERAEELARYYHQNQKDKLGDPYWWHLAAVGDIAVGLQENKEVQYCEVLTDLRTAAWLHDIVEDQKVTHKMIADWGFNSYVQKMVEAVTKRPNEQQTFYLARLLVAGRGALLLKLADLYSNTEYARMSKLPKTTQVRLLAKYSRMAGAIESILEVKSHVRRAWFLRQLLASLKAEGYTEYSGTTTYTGSSGAWVRTWDSRQNKLVSAQDFIGGPGWDGWYYQKQPGGGKKLFQAAKVNGAFVIPSDDLIYKEPVKPAQSPVTSTESKKTTCAFPAEHVSLCTCAQAKVYTPSLDYQSLQKTIDGG